MNDDVILRLTGRQKFSLQKHLFPGDGREAVALALCGQLRGLGRQCLSVREIHTISHESCNRTTDRITWPTDMLKPLLERADTEGLSVIKVHSHPAGFNSFSSTDDTSDHKFFSSAASWVESDAIHASVVLLPCGTCSGDTAIPAVSFNRFRLSLSPEKFWNTGSRWTNSWCQTLPTATHKSWAKAHSPRCAS